MVDHIRFPMPLTPRQLAEITDATVGEREFLPIGEPPSISRVTSCCFNRSRCIAMTPLLVTIGILALLLLSGFRIAQEYQRGVIFRLGRYTGLRGPGLFWIIPLGIERAMIIDIRTRTVSAEQQQTITRDSVTIKVNAVLWYRVVDAAKSVIAVSDASHAVYQLALTGLRNIIGKHDLDEVLQERDKINGLLRESIASSTTQWGTRSGAIRDEGRGAAGSHAAGHGYAGRSDP